MLKKRAWKTEGTGGTSFYFRRLTVWHLTTRRYAEVRKPRRHIFGSTSFRVLLLDTPGIQLWPAAWRQYEDVPLLGHLGVRDQASQQPDAITSFVSQSLRRAKGT